MTKFFETSFHEEDTANPEYLSLIDSGEEYKDIN